MQSIQPDSQRPEQNDVVSIISEPSFVVHLHGQPPEWGGYCANHIQTCHHEGKYCVSFICSGTLMVIPASEVRAVEYHAEGRSHCDTCDQPLNSWPVNEAPKTVQRAGGGGD